MIYKNWLKGLFMSILFGFLVTGSGLFSLARAQADAPPGLSPGQVVPPVALTNLQNYPATSANLADFKGKIIILDFWATWCGSCRESFPKLAALQKEFDGQLQILLVNTRTTKDTPAKVAAFFQKWRQPDGSPYNLACTVTDTELAKLFPHRIIPHVAWIGPDGTFIGTTDPREVTAANIRSRLKGQATALAVKNDHDLSRPLFAAAELPASRLRHYGILVQGRVEGVPSGTRLRKSGNLVTGTALTNMSLLTMYYQAVSKLYPELGRKGFVIAPKDSSQLYPEKSPLPLVEWQGANFYSYDLVIPDHLAPTLYQDMFDDLNRYSGYRAVWETKDQECLLLVWRKGGKALNRLKSSGGTPANRLYNPQKPSLHNLPLRQLVSRLNNSNLPTLVVDDTSFSDPVDLELPPVFENITALRLALQPYGLDLVPARRPVQLLVLREN